ncbi:hypothetical protein RBWH47_02232 [Rhodopirellula baltica WH47]|uniref:Uncharacterized protein n=1 Tax=Rhodopirellula baltica WH47 TaxID=991778 RepID=F2AKB3_RHOBT|nr:hypothetical protein RBWH47_02232 [Rhodopirellula baltica WH47]
MSVMRMCMQRVTAPGDFLRRQLTARNRLALPLPITAR